MNTLIEDYIVNPLNASFQLAWKLVHIWSSGNERVNQVHFIVWFEQVESAVLLQKKTAYSKIFSSGPVFIPGIHLGTRGSLGLRLNSWKQGSVSWLNEHKNEMKCEVERADLIEMRISCGPLPWPRLWSVKKMDGLMTICGRQTCGWDLYICGTNKLCEVDFLSNWCN